MLDLDIDGLRPAKTQELRIVDLNDTILKRGLRPRSGSTHRATEVERSGDPERIRLAALRLKNSERPQKVLHVPHSHVPLAVYTMGNVGVSGTVKNLSGTKAVRVRKQAPAQLAPSIGE
jgi:hypothetical protein